MALGLAGLTTYGISCVVLWVGMEQGIIPEELHTPLVLVWAVSGLALAFLGVLRRKGD
jgi:hypothetical protein